MTKEQELILSSIRDYILGNKTEEVADIDWNVVFDYSGKHQLTPIVASQCSSFIPKDNYKNFHHVLLNVLYLNERRKRLLDELFNILNKRGIKCFIIKGPVVSSYYPSWQHRTMGDIDLVSPEKGKVNDVLIELGYKCSSHTKETEWKYEKDVMVIELNDKLINDNDEVYYKELKEFLDSYQMHLKGNKLNDDFHYIYLFAHLRKHLMKYGIGFRQFADIAILTKNCKRLNFKNIEEELKKIKLFDFAKMVLQMNEVWFGVSSPYEKTEISKEEIESKTDYIFRNGVFGYDNKDNRGQTIAARRRVGNKTSKSSNFIKKIFLSYDAMNTFDYCAFLKGRPYLLPVAWLKRVYYVISHKGIDYTKQKVSSFFVSEEYIKQKEEMFEKWGL